MHKYSISKYDPLFRDEAGCYQKMSGLQSVILGNLSMELEGQVIVPSNSNCKFNYVTNPNWNLGSPTMQIEAENYIAHVVKPVLFKLHIRRICKVEQ